MSKYWKGPEMLPDYSRPFKNWPTDISLAPKDGSLFMGRQKGTNKAFAVQWDGVAFVRPPIVATGSNPPVELCQWITFADFADIRACIWRGP